MSLVTETLRAAGIGLTFDPEGGLVTGFTVTDEGQDVAPLHRAPWVGSGEALPEGTPPHLAKLQGDFFCAPFGARDEGSPLHGWPANAPWQAVLRTDRALRAVLTRPVRGATLLKEIAVEDGHPFLYQRHD